jgi:hypothetical protein
MFEIPTHQLGDLPNAHASFTNEPAIMGTETYIRRLCAGSGVTASCLLGRRNSWLRRDRSFQRLSKKSQDNYRSEGREGGEAAAEISEGFEVALRERCT